MAATSSEWLTEFSKLTGMSPVTVLNFGRALRAAGLYAKPSRGGGHRHTRVTAAHLTNFILAQAAPQASDAVEAVTQLRSMRFAYSSSGERPHLGEGDFGSVIDGLIEGRANSDASPEEAAVRFVPHHINLSVQPVFAELIWLAPNGSILRRETYVASDSGPNHWSSFAIVKRTFIHPSLIELAARMLRDPSLEMGNADALPGAPA